MTFKIVLSLKANNFLNKIKDNKEKERIEKKLKKLKENPELGKPLAGNLSGLWSLRIGKYKAIYQIKNNELLIFILRIGHRKNIY